jgi:hypothetical protein
MPTFLAGDPVLGGGRDVGVRNDHAVCAQGPGTMPNRMQAWWKAPARRHQIMNCISEVVQ